MKNKKVVRVAKNLYRQTTDPGADSWLFRYYFNGKARYLGLGPVDLVPLVEAKRLSIHFRKLLFSGIDPRG